MSECSAFAEVERERCRRSAELDELPELVRSAPRPCPGENPGTFRVRPAHPYLLKAAADSARYEALKAQRARDAAEALKYFALAQSNYSAALATKSIAVRAGAEKGLRDVRRGLDRAQKRAR